MDLILRDEKGQLLPLERTLRVQEVYQRFKELTDWERGLVACWFCKHCHRFVGPGDSCHCANDE